MVNGFSAIVQVESILVGVRVAAGTERTGTEAETDVMFIRLWEHLPVIRLVGDVVCRMPYGRGAFLILFYNGC